MSGRPGRTAHRPLFSCQRTSHSATLGRNPRFLLRIITAKARSSSGVAARSGHSTYRLVLPEDTNEEKFLKDWVRLGELGCTYERATRRYVAIDVLPHADIYAVSGLWSTQASNPKVGTYGGGSEAANALAAPAIAAALHDATGKVMRRLPMKPAYVQALLKT